MAMVVGTRRLQSENSSFHLQEYVKKAEDGEIDVFEAEKYFNEEIKPEYVQLNMPRVRFQTTNIRSESESSWNSSGVLLQRTTKNNNSYCINNDIHPLPRTNKNNQIKNFISTLGCNCYCNGRNSVDTLKTAATARRSIQIERKSLDIFGSSPVQRIPCRNRPTVIDYETGSDASSDLFEIESFTTNTNTETNTNTDPNNNVNGTNTPSEASVDWSVVTASAADISVLSDFDDMRTMSFCSNVRKMSAVERNDDHVRSERQRSGILSGCKSYKAVRVAGDGNKKMAGSTSKSNGCRILMQHRNNNKSESKFGVERKVAGFEDLRNERLGFEDRFVSQTHASYYPRFLYA